MWIHSGAVTVRACPPAWLNCSSIVRVAMFEECVVVPWSDSAMATMSEALVLAARVTVKGAPNSMLLGTEAQAGRGPRT